MENNVQIDIIPYVYTNNQYQNVSRKEKYVKFSLESNVQYYDPKKPILKHSNDENVYEDDPKKSFCLTKKEIINCFYQLSIIIMLIAAISFFIFILILEK